MSEESLSRLLDLLDQIPDSGTEVTSVRLPTQLKEAVSVASELGMAVTMTSATVEALTQAVRRFADDQIIEEHYKLHPEAIPTLLERVVAVAELTGDPLANQQEVLAVATERFAARKADPTPGEVLAYAAGMQDQQVA